eukprot:3720803-Alexandrium_andersonii.AAC.1
MRDGFRRSKLELRGTRKAFRVGSKLHPTWSRPRGSASFCALTPMVTTKQAGGRAGGAFRGGPRGGAPPGKTQCEQQMICGAGSWDKRAQLDQHPK